MRPERPVHSRSHRASVTLEVILNKSLGATANYAGVLSRGGSDTDLRLGVF
jgi:hypothetical protein